MKHPDAPPVISAHFSPTVRHGLRCHQPGYSPGVNEDGFSVSGLDKTVERVARQLAATAIERDRRGGHAREERERLRAAGLLTLSVPRAWGGEELPWSRILKIIRRLAEADSSLAHILGFHHLQVASVLCFGDEAQRERYLRGTIEKNWFWGNALSPLATEPDTRTEADGTLRLTATKRFCSGALGSDMLTVSLHRNGADRLRRHMAVVPTARAGITVNDDWDNIGQRQTDSGTVRFDNVTIAPDEVLAHAPSLDEVRGGLRNGISQLILANLYLGIGFGALAEGRRYTLENSRSHLAPGVESAGRDPYVLHRYGNLWTQLSAARALTDAVLARYDAAWAQRDDLPEEEHHGLALAISETKVFNARVGLEVAEQIFDAAGARATASRFGLDRFWRNIRTHSLHDPIDYRLRDLGVWYLHGDWPVPPIRTA
ncbi:acyl-CoA dehydrogenase [Opitutaceae bacterium TAV5]|nr:acyl-CoA dehydrogenase [Opitutaceae bacterium TAV5]